jgi:hypothetical protein
MNEYEETKWDLYGMSTNFTVIFLINFHGEFIGKDSVTTAEVSIMRTLLWIVKRMD